MTQIRVWQKKNACRPYQIPEDTLMTTFHIKVYCGDNETDHPEFSEEKQIAKTLQNVMCTRSPHVQFKIDLNENSEVYFPDLCEETISTARQFHDAQLVNVNTRVSGAAWKFPMHFDAVDQVILHHSGVKRWRVLDRVWTCGPGDVLFIQAGVWHSVENDENNGACMISNAQFLSQRTKTFARRFEDLYKSRTRDIENRRDTVYRARGPVYLGG